MGILDILGSGSRRGGGISPITLALLGTLAYRTLKGKGKLAEMLGTAPAPGNPPASAGTPGVAQPSVQGGLGGLLGGLAGGGLGTGLRDLFERFRESGHEEKAQSWVSTGTNRSLEPSELEQVLGEERLQWLMEQTGLPKSELLAGLSKELPSAVDELTPGGKLPTDEEVVQQLKR